MSKTKVLCKKKTFDTKPRAEYALTLILANSKPGDRTPVRSYRCEDCGHWHLTGWPSHVNPPRRSR